MRAFAHDQDGDCQDDFDAWQAHRAERRLLGLGKGKGKGKSRVESSLQRRPQLVITASVRTHAKNQSPWHCGLPRHGLLAILKSNVNPITHWKPLRTNPRRLTSGSANTYSCVSSTSLGARSWHRDSYGYTASSAGLKRLTLPESTKLCILG